MYRLEHRRPGAVGVQVGRRRIGNPSGHRPAQVGEDVTEKVVGHDDVVDLGPLNKVDAGRVHMLMRGLNLRILDRHLIKGPLPQVSCEGQHVLLVNQREVVALAVGRLLEGVPDTAFDAVTGVDRALRGDLVRGVLPQKPPSPA